MYKELKKTVAEMTAAGETFEITEVEVEGRRLRAWAAAPSNLREVWLKTVEYGENEYLVYGNERWTYAQAHEEVARIANGLYVSGVGQHDRVAIAMRNYPEWILSFWAIVSIGAVPVGVNAWWVAEELKYGLKDSAPKMLICDQERLERFNTIRHEFPNLKVVAVRVDKSPDWVDSWSNLLAAKPKLPDVTINADDDASIFYTSGTTGYPKGAQLTHRGCVNNLFSVLFINTVQAEAIVKIGGLHSNALAETQRQVSSIIATPLFHVAANNCLAQTMTMVGGKLVFMYRWDAGEALRIIEQEKITNFTGVPVMGRELINHPDFDRRDTSTLMTLNGSGAAVPGDLIEKILQSGGGIEPAQGYGMTEVCGVISTSTGNFLLDKPTSTGLIIPIHEVKTIDDDGNDLPKGELGEICVKSVQVIKGYLNKPEATGEAFCDGWFRTGDIGFIDEENFIHLVDRVKDMVLRGGENVYCSEVESALYKLNGVSECAVFSVPDSRLGEEVGAAIFPVREINFSAHEIRKFCRTQLAEFKVPRYIWILDRPIPRNATGKFVKRELQKSLRISEAS